MTNGDVEIHGPFSVPEPELLLLIGHLLIFVSIGLIISIALHDFISNETSRIRFGIILGVVGFVSSRNSDSILSLIDLIVVIFMFSVPIVLTSIAIRMLINADVGL